MHHRRLQLSALFGNLFEHYDTALYVLLTPFIAPLFFPSSDPINSLILGYGLILLSKLSKPIGSLFFGYLGDTKGRGYALYISLLGVAATCLAMALIPTYNQIGPFAPILLFLNRTIQSFFASGETIGGAVFLLEQTPDSKKDFMSSLYSSSTVGGILLGSLAITILCFFSKIEESWRLLYFLGSITAFFGVLLRKTQTNSQSPKDFFQIKLKLPLIIPIVLASGFSYANYSISLVMINGLVPLITDISSKEIMALNTILLALDMCALPLFGLLAKRFSRTNMMISASLFAAISAIPLFALLPKATLLTLFFIRISFVLIGVWFSATFHSWSQALVPPSHRSTIISFSYAIGSQFIGGPTSMISLWLFKQTGIVSSVAWYWMALGIATAISMFIAKKQVSQTVQQKSLRNLSY